MKKLLQRFGVWLARKGGLVIVPRPREDIIAAALEFVRHCEDKPNGWEWKQRQCMRSLMNRFPRERIRTLSLAIEVAVLECSE